MALAFQWSAEWWDSTTTKGPAALHLPDLVRMFDTIKPSAECTLARRRGPLHTVFAALAGTCWDRLRGRMPWEASWI